MQQQGEREMVGTVSIREGCEGERSDSAADIV